MHYSFKSTPTYTFKSRSQTITKSNQKSSVPGPSDYTVKKPLPKTATIAHTSQKRNLYGPFEPFPSPGTYQAKSYITNGPKRSMSARYIDYTKRTPGPHDYDNNTLKVKLKSPGFTMATKSKSYRQLEKQKNTYKPAPTSYDSFKGSFNKPNKTVIGTSERKDLTQTQKTPAPNYYLAEKSQVFASTANPRCTIGGEFRDTAFGQKEKTPGPAFYEKKSFVEENKDKNKGYSCRNKIIDLIATQLSKFPAPGQYQSHLKNKSRAPRFASTSQLRKTFMDDMQDFKKQYPSPGTHSPQLLSSKYKSNKSFVFTKSNRKDLCKPYVTVDQNQRTPGPPQYINDKINMLNTAPNYSIGKTIPKNQFLQVNPENPAPSHYQPNYSQVMKRPSSCRTGKEKRPDFEKHRYTPAPGSYDLMPKQDPHGWIFNKEKRIAFTDYKMEAKGGTIYDIPSAIANPPKYMKVQSKIKYGSQYGSTGFSNKK